ncbi:MAG: carboxypeptidase regulatory-like domain-containing protein [Nitrospirae bacterium]|nr:carboxypeptidase regulatory-like domain-containing protein [Nitrospirota bacterium]
MKIKYIFLLIAVFVITSGCYATITGKVLDAETGEPVEGAVVLVEWTKTKGFGLTYTESYKVIEAVTDKEGKVMISGTFNPLVNPPDLTVYKKGYVAWNNKFIFPKYEKRKDFKWEKNYIIKMDRFKPEYKYSEHVSFIHSAIHLGLGEKKLIVKAIESEENKAFEERQKLK